MVRSCKAFQPAAWSSVSAMSGRFYLISQQQCKHVSIQKCPLVQAASDRHPLTLYPRRNSRGNVDKYFSAEFDFDRSLTIIISLTSPQARAMKSSRHADPTQGALHCCFTTSWVSLYGITLACRWQTMTMKMFCSWLTVPMLCCHNTCQLNII